MVGELPFCLLQVHGPVPAPGRTSPFTVEIHVGGGLVIPDVSHLLRTVLEALEIPDMGITASGTLIRRVEAPLSPPDPPGSPPTNEA